MGTLLMRLAAPMQSWGNDSKFEVRRTGREPSKSGVIGMVAAALGLRRDEDEKLSELAGMRFGVRVDREGKMMRDFHMVHGEKSYLTNRYYLADAVFTAGLESENEQLLQEIDEVLGCPAFPLYLGRRSCPPAEIVRMGISEAPLEQALRMAPFLSEPSDGKKIRLMLEAEEGESGLTVSFVRDQPVSFNPFGRKYEFRPVVEKIMTLPGKEKDHDAMAELE